MLKTALLTLLALSIAIGGGAASVWYALKEEEAIGALAIGGWTTYPDIGTPHADPYSKAKVAREGLLALGRAEGLAFTATHDAAGDPLLRQCAYRMEGTLPSARFWTLHATDLQGGVIRSGTPRAVALDSYEAIRQPDNSVVITVGAHPAPGNWLAISGTGPMSFVLILYDTTIATSTEIAGVELPQILKVGCDA